MSLTFLPFREAIVKAYSYIPTLTVDLPDAWRKVSLDRILDKEGVILSTMGMIKLDDISHLRKKRIGIVAISGMLKGFAGGILVFGTLGQLGKNPASMLGVIAVSGSSFAAGWLMNKFWKYKVYKVGRQNRLKLLDLSLPQDPYGKVKKA